MLSIIIITRNTRELLRDLLSSIEADVSITPITREIIVMDNGSTDGTEEMVNGSFRRVTYLKNVENRGFAAAVNRGYAASSGELLLFLNSDTRLLEGELAKMVSFVEANPDVGIAGPLLVYPDGRAQRSFAPAPSLLSEIVPKALLTLLFPGRYSGKLGKTALPVDVESLIGAALLVRRTVMQALGGFDERFFFFLEETDLCMRARKNGYRVIFFPDSKVVHLQGQTVGKNWVRGRIEYAISLYKFLGKYHSAAYRTLFVAIRILKAVLFLGLVTGVPPLLLKNSIKRKYSYYAQLLLWHIRGCPDSDGLRTSLPE